MKAVIANRAGGPEVLELVEIAEPKVNADEVKIAVKAFGLNKAESYYRSGNYGTLVPGQALGIEAVGVVVEDTTNTFKVGQTVATAMGGLMFARHGGYAQFITANVAHVVAIDADLPFEQLAALPESYLTIWGALDKNLNISQGQRLLVRGATSSVGLSAVAYAKARGLTVIATTRQASSEAKLKAMGADHVLIDNGTVNEALRAIYPEGVDNALEVVGAATVKDTLKTIRPWGQVAVIGLLGGAPIIDQFNLMADLPNTVKLSFFSSGLLGSAALPLNQSPLNWIAQQVAKGTMPSTVAKVFNVKDIQAAHQLLDSNQANGKIVVTF